jgi:hypothetical protein
MSDPLTAFVVYTSVAAALVVAAHRYIFGRWPWE